MILIRLDEHESPAFMEFDVDCDADIILGYGWLCAHDFPSPTLTRPICVLSLGVAAPLASVSASSPFLTSHRCQHQTSRLSTGSSTKVQFASAKSPARPAVAVDLARRLHCPAPTSLGGRGDRCARWSLEAGSDRSLAPLPSQLGRSLPAQWP